MATPPLLKRLNEETVLESIRGGRADLAGGDRAPRRHLEAHRLARPPRAARRRARAGGGRGAGRPDLRGRLLRARRGGGARPRRRSRRALPPRRARRPDRDVRARQDVELAGADAESALEAIVGLATRSSRAAGLGTELIDQAIVGVPGRRRAARRHRSRLATNVPGLDGRPLRQPTSRSASARPSTLENDVNLAALGERRLGVARGVDDFMFLSVGTGLGAGLVLRGELQRGHHGAAGELDYVAVGLEQEIDPCAAALSALGATARRRTRRRCSPRRSTPRTIFAAARAGDTLAREVVREEARRIALHIAPIAAVTDVGLVVLGGGIGANADLLTDVRPLLATWLPYPPRRRDLEPRRRSGADGRGLGRARVGARPVFVSRRSPG